ncbi:MAG: hypothetical protein WAM53_10090 [Terrimicrobiaceae bacterium]
MPETLRTPLDRITGPLLHEVIRKCGAGMEARDLAAHNALGEENVI